MLALELLKWAAGDSPSASAERLATMLAGDHEREFTWIMRAGLGPMLQRATREHLDRVPSARRDTLLSTDLTAQVRHAATIDTAKDVIDACSELGVKATLLKGISVSDQYYPAPHLRPMEDIDILIPGETYEAVESAVVRRGYIRKPDHDPLENTRHGFPLRHPRHQVWVELHTALFENTPPNAVFGSSHICARSVESTFHARRVMRLADELQLLYIASSWIADLSRYGTRIHPSCLPALLDVTFLLKARAAELECDALFGWPEGEMAVASLYVMLGYLSSRGVSVCRTSHIPHLASRQNTVGKLQLGIIHAMLDYYLLGGRYWKLPIPLPVPGRYNVRNQLRKKVFTRLRANIARK